MRIRCSPVKRSRSSTDPAKPGLTSLVSVAFATRGLVKEWIALRPTTMHSRAVIPASRKVLNLYILARILVLCNPGVSRSSGGEEPRESEVHREDSEAGKEEADPPDGRHEKRGETKQ